MSARITDLRPFAVRMPAEVRPDAVSELARSLPIRREWTSAHDAPPRIADMAHAVFEIAAELGALGADTRMARVDREPCGHCQMVGHVTCVRFTPRPGTPHASESVPDACWHCAPGVLVGLQEESDRRAPIVVEIWHPQAVA